MNILVTGGAGFIGSHVCEKLLQEEHHIICIDDINDYYDPQKKEKNVEILNLKSKEFEFFKIDIRNKEDLKEIFEKRDIDAIIHLGARAGVRPSLMNPKLYEQVNILGTLNLLELSKEFKINKFIFASSSSVYGTNPKIPFSEEDKINNIVSPYAATKRAGELFCQTYAHLYNIQIICLRFFTVYGPRGRPDMAIYKFTNLIYNDKEIEMYGDGNTKRDYTYVDDTVKGIINSLKLITAGKISFEIINLGNNNPIKLKELIQTIETKLNKKAKIKVKEQQSGDVPITYADLNKAQQMLNYQPKINIKEGIDKFIEWFLSEKRGY